jgi:DNA polymerase-1
VDLAAQIPLVEELLAAFRIPCLSHLRYEADDVIATAAFNLHNSRWVYVVSGDKDLQQLQGGNVVYYCLNNKSVLPRRVITSKWGVKRPSQVAIALAILGESVDKVPGIKGWGPKKVEKLFAAVTEDMGFDDALSVIERQIPDELLPVFYESLNLTMLNRQVPDVPEPNPIKTTTMEKLEEGGLQDVERLYARALKIDEAEDTRLNRIMAGIGRLH